jgi:hypothetical protein
MSMLVSAFAFLVLPGSPATPAIGLVGVGETEF